MKILVTGAKGFIGRNLCAQLNNIRTGKAGFYGDVKVSEVREYDRDSTAEDLDRYCRDCDFVFNLAGVNRTDNTGDFMKGNFGFVSTLLDTLKKYGNKAPVMISSSIQASLSGRFGVTEYGISKRAGEDLLFDYGRETGAKVLVYRFPNVFGKWCRPGYNSAVATFCHNIANGLPVKVSDSNIEMELLYIDDLVDEMVEALKGREHRCREDSVYCSCPKTHRVTLGEIVDKIYGFAQQPKDLFIPMMPHGSFTRKLYSTYLSYLPKDKIAFPLCMNIDGRGSFTELVRSLECGQVSVNVIRPGMTKGEHWHNSKWEQFIVVSGHALIRLRRIDTDERLEFEVCGERMEVVQMIPGYTHNISNLSNTEDLVTVMYCNETFDPGRQDTYYLQV